MRIRKALSAFALSALLGLTLLVGVANALLVGNPPGEHRVAVCHQRGNGTFKQITVDHHAVAAHERHGDFVVDSEHPCPPPGAGAVGASAIAFEPPPGEHRVEVCHQRGNETWKAITVDKHAVPAHLRHGDFVVDSEHPCPPSAGLE